MATLPQPSMDPQRVIGENRVRMAKAALPKRENEPNFLLKIGKCLDYARHDVGWTIDQLARELKRDSKQVARWIRGEERTQVDVVWSVPQLRPGFLVALSFEAEECEVETVVRVRRAAR